MFKINQLQRWLSDQRLQGIVIPMADEYQNEFVPDAAKRLRRLSGFSGTSGIAIILQDSATLFIDGRYNLQAIREVDPDHFTLHNLADESIRYWINSNLSPHQVIAIDPRLHTLPEIQQFQTWLAEAQCDLHELTENPIDTLWLDRPSVPCSQVNPHPIKQAGISSEDKRNTIGRLLRRDNVQAYLVSAPEELAWLLNIRANDLPYVPVCLSYALLRVDGNVTWFVDNRRISTELKPLIDKGVTLLDPDRLEPVLAEQSRGIRVGVNMARTPYYLVKLMATQGEVLDTLVIEIEKARKNAVEIQCAKNAQCKDSIAIIRFLVWLEEAMSKGMVTEIEAAEKITAFRRDSSTLIDISFPPITASGPNAALPHYQCTDKTNRVLNTHPIYLLDSGGHYDGATTDITRTVALSDPTAAQRRAYTLVLKGHIALAMARFPAGTLGIQLDALARQFLWTAGMNYNHATGHGVGSYLHVHEGPAQISQRLVPCPLEEGMIVSNEPGYYEEGEYGIRIENEMLVKKSGYEGFLEFETLTLAPMDHRLVDIDLLTDAEKGWLMRYQQRIDTTIAPALSYEEQQWLQQRADFFNGLAPGSDESVRGSASCQRH